MMVSLFNYMSQHFSQITELLLNIYSDDSNWWWDLLSSSEFLWAY